MMRGRCGRVSKNGRSAHGTSLRDVLLDSHATMPPGTEPNEGAGTMNTRRDTRRFPHPGQVFLGSITAAQLARITDDDEDKGQDA